MVINSIEERVGSEYLDTSKQNCPEAIVGMKILHQDYGELTITEVERRDGKTIICVVDSHGETSSKTWDILLANNMIKII